MLQTLKVALLRRFYRVSAWRTWRAPSVHGAPGALELAGATGPIRAHLYRGRLAGERPLVVYFHGGGWVVGDLQTHHAYCTALCEASGASIIAVDYRLAPEHPFPAAQDDALAAVVVIADRLADFGDSSGSLVLAGDSAGGHLALSARLAADERLAARISGLIATYPVVDHYSHPYDSYIDRARGQALTASLMRWFWDTYLADADPAAEGTQRAFPIRSPALVELPPVLLCTAGKDPLRDEGVTLLEKLRGLDVAVEYEHYADAEHGFACSLGPSDEYRSWLTRCADFIARRASIPL